jgi:outer membrane murein-binding lipoprotein Lpp
MDKRNKRLLDSIIEYLNPRFNKIENEISSLKSDVSSLKSDVSSLKSDVSSLKSDVSSLKSDVATINKYISTESKVKEITANKLVEDFFNAHNTHYKKIGLKYFYNRKGKEITELDGCYIIHPKDSSSEKSFINIVNRKYNRITNEKAVADMLKINKTAATSYSPTSKLLIVECKNLFNKYMVDKKILQLTEIHKILEERKIKRDGDSKVYTQMIKQEKVDKLPKELYIILIGHISQMIFQYIQKCNSGITKEEYDMFEIEEMRDSVEFKELSKRIPNFNQKCKNTKMIDYFIDKYPSEELLKKIKSNTKSYEDMQESLEFIKGKIGYLFYDREEVTF